MGLRDLVRKGGLTTRAAKAILAELTVPVPSAGGVGAACWFEIPAPVDPEGTSTIIPWEPQLDGIPPFTDAEVGADPAQIVVVNGGAWHFNLLVSVNNITGEGPIVARLFIARSDDSVGPLYNMSVAIPVAAVENDHGTGGLSFDIDLADGEYIVATVQELPAWARVNDAMLSCRRLGPVVVATVDDGVVFADSFNRVNGVLGAPWVTQIGTGFETISNQAGCSDMNPAASTFDAGTDNYAVDVDVPNVTPGVAVMVRFTDVNNYVRVLMTGAVQDVVAGVPTTIGTLSGGFVLNEDQLTVSAVGDTVTVDRNGVQEMAGTTTVLTGSLCGLLSVGDDTCRIDNFKVRTL